MLSGGSAPNEGYIKIRSPGYFNYSWSGVCDDNFGLQDANVICKMAGYPLGAISAVIQSKLGHGSPSNQFLLDQLNCAGTEENIFECPHAGLSNHNCKAHEWAGVVCKPNCPMVGLEVLYNITYGMQASSKALSNKVTRIEVSLMQLF